MLWSAFFLVVFSLLLNARLRVTKFKKVSREDELGQGVALVDSGAAQQPLRR